MIGFIRRNIGLWVGIPVSLVCLFLAFRGVNLGELKRILGSCSISWLILSIFLQAVQLLVKGWRWQYLLNPFERIRVTELTEIYTISLMVNDTLPGKLGEMAKAAITGNRYRVSVATVFSTIIIERFLDVVFIMLCLGYVLWRSIIPMQLGEISLNKPILGVMLIIMSVILLAIFSQNLSDSLIKLPSNKPTKGFAKVKYDLLKGLVDLKRAFKPKVYGYNLLGAWISTALGWLLIVLSTLCVFRAFDGLNLGLDAAFLVIVVTAFSMMIPSSPGYVGTYHWMAIETFKYLGVGESTAAALAVVMHASWFLLEVSLGIVFSFKLSLKFSELYKVADHDASH